MTKTVKIAIAKIIFVYNAEFSILGGMQYVLEALATGREPCALCDITHNIIFEKRAWKAYKGRIEPEIVTLYRNQLTLQMERALDGAYPSVLIERTDGTFVKVLGAEALENFEGNPMALFQSLQAAIAAHR